MSEAAAAAPHGTLHAVPSGHHLDLWMNPDHRALCRDAVSALLASLPMPSSAAAP